MSKRQYCIFNARGYCRDGESCARSHDPQDVPPCHFFTSGIPCPYGQRCWFRHISMQDYEKEQAQRNLMPQPPVSANVTQLQNRRLQEITNNTKLESNKQPITKLAKTVKPAVSTEPTQNAAKRAQPGGAIPKKVSEASSSCPGKSKTGPCKIKPKKGCSNKSCKKHCQESGRKCVVHGVPAISGAGDGDEGGENRNPNTAATKSQCPGKDGACTGVLRKGCKNKMCIKCCQETGKFICPAHDKPSQGKGKKHKFDIQKYYRIWDHVKPSRRLQNHAEWDTLVQSGELSRMRNLYFGPDFGIKDIHLETIAQHCKDIQILSMGDEESGDGAYVTDKAVIMLAENCPKLTRLKLEAFKGITDKGLTVILEKCQELQSLEISGNDKCYGRITTKGVKLLLQRNMAPKLQHLETNMQSVDFEVLEKLEKYRKNLTCIDEDRAWDDLFSGPYKYCGWGGGFW